MSINQFKPGDKVRCMDMSNPRNPHLDMPVPVVGQVYTVRGNGNFVGIPGIYLEEIKGVPRQPFGPEEQSYREDRFVLVEQEGK